MNDQFTFFYGGPFSNWFEIDFTVDGIKYCNSEQYMMAEKARMFGDKEAEAKILRTRDPQRAKILGRSVKNFNKDVWESKARDVVYKACYHKFTQNKGIEETLLDTKGTLLVEASPTDQIWGIGWGDEDEQALDPAQWRGTNWLGEVLTKVREDIIAGVETTENFEWSDATVDVFPVTITNERDEDLWIWDHDKMKRWASQIHSDFSGITDIKVVVCYTDSLENCVEIEVCRGERRYHVKVNESLVDRSILDTFKDAMVQIRNKLIAEGVGRPQ